jgi:hypothetical protein
MRIMLAEVFIFALLQSDRQIHHLKHPVSLLGC